MVAKNKILVALVAVLVLSACFYPQEPYSFLDRYTFSCQKYVDTVLGIRPIEAYEMTLKDNNKKTILQCKQHNILQETEAALLVLWYDSAYTPKKLHTTHIQYIDSILLTKHQKENVYCNTLLPLNAILSREGVRLFMDMKSANFKKIEHWVSLVSGAPLTADYSYITNFDTANWSLLLKKYSDSMHYRNTYKAYFKSLSITSKKPTIDFVTNYKSMSYIIKKQYDIVNKIGSDNTQTHKYYALLDTSSNIKNELFFCLAQTKDRDGYVQLTFELLNPINVYIPEGFYYSLR